MLRPRALLLCVCASLVHCKMRRADRKAMVDFFKMMGGPYWHRNDGWIDGVDGGTDPCDIRTHWYGLGCIDPCDIYRDGPTCAFGRVTALNLRDNNLTGSITNWTGIGDIHNVTWMDLSVNAISGTIPAEIGNINDIEVLNLAWNKLEGPLPDTIGHMNSNNAANLNELSLEWNRLEGTLPSSIGLLTRLRKLDMGHNLLSGSIPPSWTNLTELQVLYVSDNRVTGAIPEEIGNIHDLRFFNLTDNSISGTLPASIGDLGDLHDLSLSYNSISGSLPLELGNLYGLRFFRISDNQLDGNFTKFSTMGHLRKLITWDSYNNKMTDDLPKSIQNSTSIQYLYADNQHYKVLRKKYCRQRLPNNGKYNYRIVRDEFANFDAHICEDMYSTEFTFQSLQESGVYPD